jgi:hypothetical protein
MTVHPNPCFIYQKLLYGYANVYNIENNYKKNYLKFLDCSPREYQIEDTVTKMSVLNRKVITKVILSAVWKRSLP